MRWAGSKYGDAQAVGGDASARWRKAKQAVKAKLTMTLKPAGAKALTATVNVTLARK